VPFPVDFAGRPYNSAMLLGEQTTNPRPLA